MIERAGSTRSARYRAGAMGAGIEHHYRRAEEDRARRSICRRIANTELNSENE
ncbi:MAG: hypothetical protein KO254_05455 [Methanoculleus marisnigri]|nr:hypothetical protein [Methanoculleus marisnigri]